MDDFDAELSILETIYLSQKHSEAIKQRALAQAASLSLGMTNALIKRFLEKGWITVRRINTRNIQYAITPEGVNEIAHRAFRYFKRTIHNVSIYKQLVEDLIAEKCRQGYTGVLLAGPSDLEFIVEYSCQKFEMLFIKAAEARKNKPMSGKFLYLISENQPSPEGQPEKDTLYLVDVFSRRSEAAER
jgi:DNA-binding MarR family transcriptional regulator